MQGRYRFPKLASGLLTALLLVLPVEPVRAAETFVPGFEDLPLMPGLDMIEGSSIVFDKPDGRIVEAAARGEVAPSKLRAFYEAVLPELGWAPWGADAYHREGETLRLEISSGASNGGILGVRFILSPQ